MELFWLEHKKLWRKKIVKICVLLCFVYCVIFGSILSFQLQILPERYAYSEISGTSILI